jgi:hypothetical protein
MKPNFPEYPQFVSEYENISNPTEANDFFAKYGVGNVQNGVSKPFERQLAYELLLDILNSINPEKYQNIHKGTPYYFIGWTAYQYRDFAKAIFYMDAAVSEDLKFLDIKSKVHTTPTLNFFLLQPTQSSSGFNFHVELHDVVSSTLKLYMKNGGGTISIDKFRSQFIDELLYSDPKDRSLLTALYTFLLEYEESVKQVNLRSNNGGSILPFLDHLFDGARILESLLEKKGDCGETLRPKIVNTKAISVTEDVLKSRQTLADAENVYTTLLNSSFQDRNFASAFIIRNTTGHSLLWPDNFNASSYTLLYNSLINSIFWTIEKLWLYTN